MPELFLLAVGGFAVGTIVYLALRPKRTLLDEREVEPATAGDGYHYKPKPNISFEKIKREEPPRTFGKRAALAAQYGRKQPIFLSPRMIERANIERRRRGAPALNRAGVKNAIAHPWDRPDVRQPETGVQWLTYLIMYEVLADDHHQAHCSGTGGITIDPNQPYNGQGGEFAGAGASGDWTSAPVTASIATEIAVGAGVGALQSDDKYAPGDRVGGYDSAPSSMNPDPGPTGGGSAYASPSYVAPEATINSAPDPTPSYSAPDPAPSDSSGGFSGGDGS